MSTPAPSVALHTMASTLTALATAAYKHDTALGQHLAVNAALLAVHATAVARAEAEAAHILAGINGLRAKMRQQEVTIEELSAELAAETDINTPSARRAWSEAIEHRRQQRAKLLRLFPSLARPEGGCHLSDPPP
jgi:hypothetical protein